ncbi:MAG TPA: hypothetical protein VNW54_14090 [Granulicella sp.]|jgi:hypothetical protein|nr:hypothetical protein [Granulicella sp.]
MHGFKFLALAGVAAVFLVGTPQTQAQIDIRIGVEPHCPYGYYDYAPYNCAPYGYYGPQWFHGGVFVGAGRWFHGPAEFHGTVDNRFDPRHGYHGHVPDRGEHPAHDFRASDFHGNEERDGRGNAHGGGHDQHDGGHDQHDGGHH